MRNLAVGPLETSGVVGWSMGGMESRASQTSQGSFTGVTGTDGKTNKQRRLLNQKVNPVKIFSTK